MNIPVVSSTFFLTLLLMVGLFFFIRASVKERTQQLKLISSLSEESLLSQLQEYFQRRAYKVAAVDAAENQVTFQGFVRPSLFLAIFLTILAAIGLGCLALVFSLLYPTGDRLFFGLIVLAPVAGIFYWQKAGRVEKVSLKLEAAPLVGENSKTLVSVTAHRDELNYLKQALPLETVIEE